MPRKVAALLPSTEELLRQLGDRLRLARRRRRLSAKQVAVRAGMAPMTLRSLERGGSGVTMGAYLAVMQVLGIERDLDLVAQADPMGRALQDARLSARSRTTGRTEFSSVPNPKQSKRAAASATLTKPAEDARNWIEKGGFASSRTLADLIDVVAPVSKAKGR